MQAEADHQKSKYKKLNKSFTESKTSKKYMVNISDSSDTNSNSSYSIESNNYSPRTDKRKTLITYDLDFSDNGENSISSTSCEDSN